jgi:glutathione synthase/RimK-type ligase-like ATP-grasp enzyme
MSRKIFLKQDSIVKVSDVSCVVGMSVAIIGQKKSESNLRLLEEAKKRFGSVFFVPIEGIGIGLGEKFSITYRTSDMQKFRAIFPRVPSIYRSYAYQLLSLFSQHTFMPIKPISFLLTGERFFMLTVLRKREIPTIRMNLARSERAAYRIIGISCYPSIIRSPDKSTGITVKNRAEAKNVVDALIGINQPVLVEEVVKEMVSVYVADPDVLAAVRKKTKETDLVFSRGELKGHKLDLGVEQLAIDTARALDTQLARVDISTGGEEPTVANVELCPELVEPSGVTGVDLPSRIMDSFKANYEAHQQRPIIMKFFEDAKSVVKDVLRTKQLL